MRFVFVALWLAACSHPAPPSASARGTVREGTFHSEALGVDKRYVVWLPAGYDREPARRWPVIYMLHGLGGNERDWVDAGKLDQAAADLGLQAIVVMPDGDAGFYADAVTPPDYEACLARGSPFNHREPPSSFCVKKGDYETYVVRDLVGHIDATFRTKTDRSARAIGGLSMGGFGALSLSLRHPDLFGAAASHSGVVALFYVGPHPYVRGQEQLGADVERWGRHVGAIGELVRGIFGHDVANWRAHDPATLLGELQPGKVQLYLDCGTDDGFSLQDSAAFVHDLLDGRGVSHTYYSGPGRHDFSFWKQRLPHSLEFFARFFAAS
jgi:S-formylglutathione hydrolase FrmB